MVQEATRKVRRLMDASRSAESDGERQTSSCSPPPATSICAGQLIEAHLGLAEHLARRFTHRGEAYDDLVQVELARPREGGGPLRPRAGSRVHHLRHADDHRRAEAALPRPGLGGPGTAANPGALPAHRSGHLHPVAGERPLTRDQGDRASRPARPRTRSSRRSKPARATARPLSTLPGPTASRSAAASAPTTPRSPTPSTGRPSLRTWPSFPTVNA